MATTIKLKNGSGAPLAGDLVQGEPALDLTNKRLYTEDSGGTVIEVGTNPSTIDINAGTIDGTVIGGSSAAAGTFTTFTSTGIDDNATSTAITIDASQNVGIGTTSPATFNAAQCNNLVVGTGSGAEGITVYSGTTSQGGLAFADGTSASDQYRGLIQYDHNSNNMLFWTNTSERMRIDSSGNVGIGTTPSSWSAAFDAIDLGPYASFSADNDTTFVTNNAYYNGTNWIYKNSNLAGRYRQQQGFHVWDTAVSGTAGGTLTWSETMRIDSNGNVGIGTSNPSFILGTGLHIDSTGYTSIVLQKGGAGQGHNIDFTDESNTLQYRIGTNFASGGQNLLFAYGSTPTVGMTLDSSGNVGIGISSLVNPLQVGVTSNTASKTSGSAFDGGAVRLDGGLGSTNSEVAILGGSNDGLSAGIGFARENSIDWGTQLRFYTHGTAITTADELTERMRIDSSGRLLVGKTSSSITTAGSEVTSASILQSASSTSTNLATNSGAVINLCNTSATDGNFSNIGGYNSNGLVVSQMNFINVSHTSRTGAITFSTHNGSNLNEAMRIDSSGQVGIGTTPNSYANYRVLTLQGTNGSEIDFENSSGTVIGAIYNNATDLVIASDFTNAVSSSNVVFTCDGTERMRIDSSGNLLIGVTTSVGGGSEGIELRGDAGYYKTARYTAGSAGHWLLYNSNGNVGSVTTYSNSTQFNTSSDQRLKENIVDAPAGNIDAIRVRSFDWKTDGSHQKYGMVAQELVDVAPEAVTQGETDDDMWQVDYSKLVPMMIKEIQDLKAEVAALKGA